MHAAQVGAVLHHVGGAAMAQPVRTGCPVRRFDQVPDPLAGQRHTAHGEKKPCTALARSVRVPCRADARQVRTAFAQISLQRLHRGSTQRHNAFLVALAAHLHAARIQSEIARGERRHLGDTQSARVEQFQNRAVAERRGAGLWMRCVHSGPLQHLHNLRLGQRFGQHLPGPGRLDIHGRVVMNAAVQQQPLVESAQAAQLARRGTRVDAMVPQMLKKRRHILLHRRQQHALTILDKLGECLQIAVVGLASKRAQALLYSQIDLVVLQERQIACAVHTSDYPRLEAVHTGAGQLTEPRSSRNQLDQHRFITNGKTPGSAGRQSVFDIYGS